MNFKKVFLYSLLIVLFGAGVFLVNLIWFRPFFINHFYNKVFVQVAMDDPEMISSMGLPVKFYNHKLTDASLAHGEKLDKILIESQATLRSYNYERQSEKQKLSTDILGWFIDDQVNGLEFKFHNYPVNQLFGIQSNMPSFMDSFHAINSKGDARDYIARLNQFGVKFDQVMEGLEKREEMGIIPPKFVISRVLKEMNDFVAAQPEDNILYKSFDKKLAATDIDTLKKDEFRADVKNSISTTVYPAYGKLITYFTKLEAKATTDDGVWKLPDGDKYYAHELRSNTTTDYTADQIHQIGLDELARITAEMRTILDSLGHSKDSTVGQIVTALSKQPRFLYPDSDAGREQALQDYQKLIDHVSANLDDVFSIKPKSPVKVVRIPEFKEKTSPGAYYQAPSTDGKRPGVFFANLRNMEDVPKFGMATLAYHEAVPGHHFQIAIQRELEGLPFFRTVLPFTAFAEGWALYAERVAWEQGFHKDPYTNLGRLQAEIFRAVRLIVDTGIHHKRWTREQAIAYMVNATGMPEGEVVAEIERYIVMPGQACAYKMGMMKILELREKARTELGDAFDIKDFHAVVLQQGSMPLEILEKQVHKYIDAKKNIALK
jgi:uncharacterized protein (DUF885 family)